MSSRFADLVAEYLALRRSLGYALCTQGRYLRAFAGFLDRLGHHGPIPLEISVRWAGETTSDQPSHRVWRLGVLRGFLRHLAAFDGGTDVPPPGCLGPAYRRKPPHIYSDSEIVTLLNAAAALSPRDGLRPHCYVTLFSLLACTGLRISEALALRRDDIDWVDGVLTIRAGKGGRTRLVPLHPSAIEPLRRYAARRNRWNGAPSDAFFRTERSNRLTYTAVSKTFRVLRCQVGWSAEGRVRMPRIHDLRHRMVVRRLLLWHAQGVDVDRKIAVLATYLGHVVVSDVYWYLTAVPELMAVVSQRYETFARRGQVGSIP